LIEAIEEELSGVVGGDEDEGVAEVFDVDAIAGEVDGVWKDDAVGWVGLNFGGLHGLVMLVGVVGVRLLRFWKPLRSGLRGEVETAFRLRSTLIGW
jgi:hypothetical protein